MISRFLGREHAFLGQKAAVPPTLRIDPHGRRGRGGQFAVFRRRPMGGVAPSLNGAGAPRKDTLRTPFPCGLGGHRKLFGHAEPCRTGRRRQRDGAGRHGDPMPQACAGQAGYLPMQKSRKITSRMSSTSTRPVSRPSARAAIRSSSASRSSRAGHVAALGPPQRRLHLLERPPVTFAGHQRRIRPRPGSSRPGGRGAPIAAQNPRRSPPIY